MKKTYLLLLLFLSLAGLVAAEGATLADLYLALPSLLPGAIADQKEATDHAFFTLLQLSRLGWLG